MAPRPVQLAPILLACIPAGCHTAPRFTPKPSPSLTTSAATPTAPSASLAWSTIGRSVRNRPIQAATVGRGPLRIYLIGAIHGDEPEGLAAIDPIAARLSTASATTRIIRDTNPDGAAAHTRGNARGRDLNRNWPARNFSARSTRGQSPLSEPETAALHRDMLAFNPDLVIVFHSSRSGPFVNFDGPARDTAAEFVAAARITDSRWRLVPDMGYPTPGSLGSYIGVDRQIPILTIEFRRGQDAASAIAAAIAGLDAVLRMARPTPVR
jgi:murein peptide amidase A